MLPKVWRAWPSPLSLKLSFHRNTSIMYRANGHGDLRGVAAVVCLLAFADLNSGSFPSCEMDVAHITSILSFSWDGKSTGMSAHCND